MPDIKRNISTRVILTAAMAAALIMAIADAGPANTAEITSTYDKGANSSAGSRQDDYGLAETAQLAKSPSLAGRSPGETKSLAGETGSLLLVDTDSLRISWTAPGDDDNIGVADHYEVRYSAQMISESNWAQANMVPDPPYPLPAGSLQNLTVTGLGRGERYYIAMKTYDDVGNVSDLSNVANKFASGIVAPYLIGVELDTSGHSAVVSAAAVESPYSLFYEFALDTASEFPHPLLETGLLADSIVSASFGPLLCNIHYFWRCRAMASDHSDSSYWSNADSFFIPAGDQQNPSVIVLSPNGGEIWDVGSIREISWSDSDDVGVVSHKLEYTADNGAHWVVISDWTAGDEHVYSWTIPMISSAQCRVRVSCRDMAGNTGSDISDNVFSIRDAQAPVVSIACPNGGEIWNPGSVQDIFWTDGDNVGIVAHRLDYSTDSGNSWQLIRDWTPGDPHAYSWSVPIIQSSHCRARVAVLDGSGNIGIDMSEGDFEIVDNGRPAVTVTCPDTRVRWDALSVHEITWTDYDNIGITEYMLEYSTNGGSSWLPIQDWTVGDPHSYMWAVPDTPSRQCRVRVSCRDASGNTASDISNRNFFIRDITKPSVHLIFPNGGDSLNIGCDTLIAWDASDIVGIDSFMIEYSVDGGAGWDTIVAWTNGNPGGYTWNIPGRLTGQCLMRVSCMDTDENVNSDTSNGVFIIADMTAPTVTITSPAESDSLDEDSIHVSWVALDNGLISRSLIEYSSDGGDSWILVWEGPGSDTGSVTVLNPGLSGDIGIKVTCVDEGQNSASDSLFFHITDIPKEQTLYPSSYVLSPAYPNPFNPTTTISYGLPEESHVTIEIYDVTGRAVERLVDAYQSAGYHTVTWDATSLPSGGYFYRMVAGEFRQSMKVMLLK